MTGLNLFVLAVLLAALVPTIYLANYYWKAYDRLYRKHAALIVVKFKLSMEVHELSDYVRNCTVESASLDDYSLGFMDAIGEVEDRLNPILQGGKRRATEAALAVNG